jgi:hypothetical protein
VVGDQTTAWRRQFNREASNGQAGSIPPPPALIGDKIALLAYQGDQAVARVIIYTEHGMPAYRQTRFYQYTAVGWRQSEADATLWGPERNLATPSLMYHFRQQDAATVIAVAPQVEDLYTTMRRNFGLLLTEMAGKPVINVSVMQAPGQGFNQSGASDSIIVPSPARYLAPAELTDAELLAQSIALPLLGHVLTEAREHYAINPAWQPMVSGLHLWQVWDLDLPLAAWREVVVKWLYADLGVADVRQPSMRPDRYTDLCAVHKLWLVAPTQINIPLLCAEQAWEYQYFSSWHSLDPATHLNQIKLPTPQYDQAEERRDRGQAMVLATLIEYAVATYGRERLPMLVAGLSQYDSWETLLPAVFGVSAAAFEAGWRTYLTDHYGVSLSN